MAQILLIIFKAVDGSDWISQRPGEEASFGMGSIQSDWSVIEQGDLRGIGADVQTKDRFILQWIGRDHHEGSGALLEKRVLTDPPINSFSLLLLSSSVQVLKRRDTTIKLRASLPESL